MTIRFPIKGAYKITSPFGPRVHPISGRRSNHNGVDLIMKNTESRGTEILAPESGKILAARKSNHPTGGYGYYVKMQGRSGVVHLMAHMIKGSLRVRKGDVVETGDVLGLMGTTGNSTGVHLHWEVRVKGKFTNPMKWFEKNGEPDLPKDFNAWTKKLNDKSVKAYIKNAPRKSKVRVRHNGISVFNRTVRPGDEMLEKTVTLNVGKNRITIEIDGIEVKGSTYSKKSNSGDTVIPPKVEKPVTKDSGKPKSKKLPPSTPEYRYKKMKKEGQLASQTIANKPDITYIVKAGDNLTKIAKEHGSTVPKIKKHNNLANANLIKIGQVLKIPQE